MNETLLRESLLTHSYFNFVRSSGPGGQNVNKVNSKVILSIHIDSLEGISDTEKKRIKERLKHRINFEGIFSLTCEEERSQYRNRERALKKAELLFILESRPEIKRIPTRPSKASKLRRLKEKKLHSINKRLRTSPTRED